MTKKKNFRVIALAGGVGGAKLAYGLARLLLPEKLTVIVNIGDDFEHLGLKICPDLDTVCYTLAGLANPETGWGRIGETWHALESIVELGGPTWFRLGDRDLGTHLERTRLLGSGRPLSSITKEFCLAWNIGQTILPVTDDIVPTIVFTDKGVLPFQEYFVKNKCMPKVKGFEFSNVNKATPAPGVLESIKESELVIFCPSNPWVSIDPILAIPGVREELLKLTVPIIAVSPIIAGETVKGPAAKMYAEMGIEPSALAVADHYGYFCDGGLLTGFVLDILDENMSSEILSMGINTSTTNTLMQSNSDREKLAREVLEFGKEIMNRNKI
jgi:LPPG:FO 2-phospho-L-lactate transferase